MSTQSRPRAAFGTSRGDIPGVQARAQTMYNGMTANVATFGSPTIPLVTFLSLIMGLADAQRDATTLKVKGLAALRNTRRDLLWTAMETLRAYVQALADSMSADGAVCVIESGGLLVARVGRRQKAILAATLAAAAGVVHLEANASALTAAAGSKRVTFFWQWSSDGGKSWNEARATPYAHTDVTGLALMTTYSFRVGVAIANVPGPWSQPVSLLVH